MKKIMKCPKCGSEMLKDRRLVSYTDISLAKENDHIGDKINTFHCKNCGYVELYQEKTTKVIVEPKQSIRIVNCNE